MPASFAARPLHARVSGLLGTNTFGGGRFPNAGSFLGPRHLGSPGTRSSHAGRRCVHCSRARPRRALPVYPAFFRGARRAGFVELSLRRAVRHPRGNQGATARRARPCWRARPRRRGQGGLLGGCFSTKLYSRLQWERVCWPPSWWPPRSWAWRWTRQQVVCRSVNVPRAWPPEDVSPATGGSRRGPRFPGAGGLRLLAASASGFPFLSLFSSLFRATTTRWPFFLKDDFLSSFLLSLLSHAPVLGHITFFFSGWRIST